MSEKTLVCEQCDVMPETLMVDGDPARLRCPICRVVVDRDVVIEATGAYLIRGDLKAFQDDMKRMARGSKNMTYKAGRLPSAIKPSFIFR